MRFFGQFVFCVLAGCTPLAAQDDAPESTDSTERSQQFTDAIEDNSFLIEEAFNQEPGIIQHISNCLYFPTPQGDFAYALTEEYPVGNQTHQLGFTIPYLWLNANQTSGIGDIIVNYRYQLAAPDAWAAISPRLSLILPSGNADRGLGNGVVGFQVNFPVSKRLTNYFIVHANAGATILPSVKATTTSGEEVKRTLTSLNLGVSGIALVADKCNVMLEVVENVLSEIDEMGSVQRSSETTFSPGARIAIDVGSLQVVPGVGLPIVFGGGNRRTGVFFYLSFEHPL